jgi:hypothetical protein
VPSSGLSRLAIKSPIHTPSHLSQIPQCPWQGIVVKVKRAGPRPELPADKRQADTTEAAAATPAKLAQGSEDATAAHSQTDGPRPEQLPPKGNDRAEEVEAPQVRVCGFGGGRVEILL